MHHASRSLIQRRYAAVHGAAPAADYPDYLTSGPADAPRATLGYRLATDRPLFLEAYLARPVEMMLTEALGRPVPRERIVELGDHASDNPRATIALWSEAATMLRDRADVAVAVLTRPLRHMLARLGLTVVEIAPARAEALGARAACWGRYYDQDPVVCAGEIGACLRRLGPAGRA